jgi:carbon-monoxide dehydrogenase medium subunit
MIRTKLLYHRPVETEKACGILMEHANDAAVLGGGTWLLPRMNRDEIAFNHVVDLRGLGLNTIKMRDNFVELGAMVTYSDVLASPELTDTVPLLQQVARGITGGNQVRNLGTLVGSACYANPSSDMPAVLVALEARLRVSGSAGHREVNASDFFLDAFLVDLRPGEFVTSFVVPRHRLRTGYYKLKISGSSWPIATATAVINETTGERTVTLGAVERRPLRIDLSSVMEADGVMRGADFADLVRQRVLDPWGDVLASADYRREVAGVVARRAAEKLKEVGNT